MDANEIDKLEGRALDAAVAEHVMGCKWVQISEHERGLVVGRDHKYLLVGVLVRDDDDRPTYVDNLPAYSLDWREAERVIGKLVELERYPSFHIGPNDFDGSINAWCELVNPADISVTADTLPLAICRAALKAVMP